MDAVDARDLEYYCRAWEAQFPDGEIAGAHQTQLRPAEFHEVGE